MKKVHFITGEKGSGKTTKAIKITEGKKCFYTTLQTWKIDLVNYTSELDFLIFEELGIPSHIALETMLEIVTQEYISKQPCCANGILKFKIPDIIFIAYKIPEDFYTEVNRNNSSYFISDLVPLALKSSEVNNSFLDAAKPLMKFLAENHNPHCSVIVESNRIQLVQGLQTEVTDEFIQ